MIALRPYDDFAAFAVLRALDVHDFIEAELTRGAAASHLSLFADWRAMEPHRVASFVADTGPTRGGQPFALFALSNTGQSGVASAALLACDHHRYRHALAQLGALIRLNLPGYAADRGIHRIETRAWAGHPTASRLLAALGFAHETDLPGFGPQGQITFRQFAWLAPTLYHPIPQHTAFERS